MPCKLNSVQTTSLSRELSISDILEQLLYLITALQYAKIRLFVRSFNNNNS